MRNLLRQLVASILFLIISLMAMNVSAALTAQLDRNQISVGETVQLLVEIDRQVSGWLDTRPLEKDFDILGNVSGSRVNIINGHINAKTTWTLTLSPKRNGELTVPSLKMEGERSQPLTLQVSDSVVADGQDSGSPIFIETEVDRQDPYVQGMVRYTVRLYYGVKLIEGRLSEPQSDEALLHRIGEDRDFTVERDGQVYRVIERQYAIFPQISGKLVLPAPVLDARIAESSTIRRNRLPDFFGGDPLNNMFTVTRPVRVRGETVVLSVQPRPDEAIGSHWLPAEHVELIENWQPQNSGAHVGEPLKRTIVIRARGVTGEQLPDLEAVSVNGFKVYPDHPKISTKNDKFWIEGEKSQSIAFVPVQSGRFTLPAINLHWWDTQNNQARMAQIPERVMEILPAIDVHDEPAQTPSTTSIIADNSPASLNKTEMQSSENNNIFADQQDNSEVAIMSPFAGVWSWLSVFFAVLWLATLGMWWRVKRHQSDTVMEMETLNNMASQMNVREAKKYFQLACKANDPQMARRRLLEWATIHWPDETPRGLDDLASRFTDVKTKAALGNLDRILYYGESQQWDGRVLMDAIKEFPPHNSVAYNQSPLPDLYHFR